METYLRIELIEIIESNKQHTAPRPRAPGAGNQRKQETKGARGKQQRRKEKKSKRRGGGQERGNPNPEGAKQSGKREQPKEKVRRTRTRPGGRPARPDQDKRAHAHTHGTRAWRPPTRKGRCRRPLQTALVHRLSPLWNDGRYGKPDESVTGSAHTNHRSASSPTPTPEGPARTTPSRGPGRVRRGASWRPCLGGGQLQAQ